MLTASVDEAGALGYAQLRGAVALVLAYTAGTAV
jgi:hypothetical protein